MANEEAIRIAQGLITDFKCESETMVDFCNTIIKALNQEPVLDKIRADIEALSNANPSYWHSGDMVDRDDVLEIIDKYRAEGEDAA